MLNYYSKQHEGIGTFCHEFSHILGLPDLYATNDAEHKTLGIWDIMASGSYITTEIHHPLILRTSVSLWDG